METYTTSGIYDSLFTNIGGCDSLVILDLTVNFPDTTNLQLITCDNYTWDGVSYSNSGIYSNLYSNVEGCDGLVILDLTINNSDTITLQAIACDSYTWLGTTYTNSLFMIVYLPIIWLRRFSNIRSHINYTDKIILILLLVIHLL